VRKKVSTSYNKEKEAEGDESARWEGNKIGKFSCGIGRLDTI